MTPATFFLIVVATILTHLAVFTWRARPSSPVNRWFAALTFVAGVWTAGMGIAHTGWAIDVSIGLAFAGASLIPATFFAFVHAYPERMEGRVTGVVRVTVGLGLTFAALSLTTPFVVHDARLTADGITREAGPLYVPFAIYFVLGTASAFVTLGAKIAKATGVEKHRLQSVGLGALISAVGGVTTNLVVPLYTGRSHLSWIGPFFLLVHVLLVAHAMIRHRLFDLRLVIHRGLTFTLAALLSFVPVAALLALIWPRVVAYLQPAEILTLLGAVGIVTVLVPITRDAAGRLLDRYVYRKRANYQRTVREASRALTRVLDPRALLPLLRNTIMDTTEAEGVVIYVRTDRRFAKSLVEARHPGGHFEAPEDLPATVVAVLDRMRDALVADDLIRDPHTSEVQQLHAELGRLNWTLVLPAVSEDSVIGAIALGPKRSGDPFYPQDLDLLMTLANQAGIAIKNARLYFQVVLANEYLENIVSTIDSGVIAVNAFREVTMLNPAAESLTGLHGAHMVGATVDKLPVPLADALVASLSDGVTRTEPEIELSDGATTRPVIYRTAPLRDPSQSILGAVAVFSDLTPVKALEVERRRAERLAYLEALAAAIAHEVKNPLVAIKTFAQLLPRRRDDDEFVENFSRVVGREIERMERLVTRLRSLSRPGERPLHPVDVRRPIADAIEFMQPSFEDKGLAVAVELGGDEAVIDGDDAELESLFLNLLINAHQATPPGGEIRVRLVRDDGHVTVEVRDSGPGIAPDVIDRVFDPFFTTKQRGSGLGLAICAGIAGTHRAQIGVANASEGGARFTVDFPLTGLTPAPVA